MSTKLSENNWKGWHTDVLVMTHAGHEIKEIASRVKKSIPTISYLKANPLFQEKLRDYKATYQQSLIEKRTSYITDTDLTEARAVIDAACKKAAEIVVEMANDCEDPRTRLAACKDILDRAGVKAIEVTQTSERVYSTEEVERAHKTLNETMEIVERLNGNTSPFVLSDVSRRELVSSVTDQGSDE